jgi:hypothetical protein
MIQDWKSLTPHFFQYGQASSQNALTLHCKQCERITKKNLGKHSESRMKQTKLLKFRKEVNFT